MTQELAREQVMTQALVMKRLWLKRLSWNGYPLASSSILHEKRSLLSSPALAPSSCTSYLSNSCPPPILPLSFSSSQHESSSSTPPAPATSSSCSRSAACPPPSPPHPPPSLWLSHKRIASLRMRGKPWSLRTEMRTNVALTNFFHFLLLGNLIYWIENLILKYV